VLAVAGAAGVALWLNSSVERIEDPFAGLTDRPAAPVPTQASDEQDASPAVAMNFLVLGSDSRISAGDPADWEAGAQRTDTIMLVHLPADGHDAWVMSIPRDSWVPIPGYGEAKINAAYSLGGPTLLIQTIEDLTGVRIDHFAIADFESFEQLTDALGGVEIVLGEDLYSRQGDLMESAGVKVLDGEEALVWARERYSLSRGDFDRVQRQQAWIRAILAKVSDEGILENPVRTVGFLDTVSHAVAVDDGLTTDVMLGLVDQVRSLKKSDVHFLTVPTSGTGRSPDGRQSIVNIDWVAFDALMAAVVADDVDGYLDEHSDDVDQLGPVAP
jgi:LCP family protein required for cell wall assembly